jgi:hypothetical protein
MNLDVNLPFHKGQGQDEHENNNSRETAKEKW